jgi:hypothetical protein
MRAKVLPNRWTFPELHQRLFIFFAPNNYGIKVSYHCYSTYPWRRVSVLAFLKTDIAWRIHESGNLLTATVSALPIRKLTSGRNSG